MTTSEHKKNTKYDISIGFMIYNDQQKFLLLQKTIDHLWDFPKGHFNPGEREELQVALRELEEETGIVQEEIKIARPFRHEHTFSNLEGTQRKIVLFLANCNADPILSKEHQAFVWVELNKAKELMRFPEKQKALQEAADFLKKILKNGYPQP